MKEIKLTKGMVALVDDEDYEYLNLRKWHADKIGNTYYASCSIIGSNGWKYRMHRMVMNVDDSTIIIDHIDQNGLNNQKSNLRIATHSQNLINKPKKKNTLSSYFGVTYDKTKQRWVGRICINGKKKSTKRFKDEVDAAIAYDILSRQFHGEFAKINFP
jgi:hypothetical protein